MTEVILLVIADKSLIAFVIEDFLRKDQVEYRSLCIYTHFFFTFVPN